MVTDDTGVRRANALNMQPVKDEYLVIRFIPWADIWYPVNDETLDRALEMSALRDAEIAAGNDGAISSSWRFSHDADNA